MFGFQPFWAGAHDGRRPSLAPDSVAAPIRWPNGVRLNVILIRIAVAGLVSKPAAGAA